MSILCQLCGDPMPKGEEMFNYHGYSCDCPSPMKDHSNPNKDCTNHTCNCPKPPLPKLPEPDLQTLKHALEESVKLQSHYAKLLNMHDGGERMEFTVESWLERLKLIH